MNLYWGNELCHKLFIKRQPVDSVIGKIALKEPKSFFKNSKFSFIGSTGNSLNYWKLFTSSWNLRSKIYSSSNSNLYPHKWRIHVFKTFPMSSKLPLIGNQCQSIFKLLSIPLLFSTIFVTLFMKILFEIFVAFERKNLWKHFSAEFTRSRASKVFGCSFCQRMNGQLGRSRGKTFMSSIYCNTKTFRSIKEILLDMIFSSSLLALKLSSASIHWTSTNLSVNVCHHDAPSFSSLLSKNRKIENNFRV